MDVPMTTRADRIEAALRRQFSPAVLMVRDDSHLHAGHAGASASGETHYAVTMVAGGFDGQSRVARSRAVHAALADEFANGLHALSLTLRTASEHAIIGA
jgi:stress-induced morphogen